MSEEMILEILLSQLPMLKTGLAMLGSFVIFGQTIVWLTPTKKDDEVLEKIKTFPWIGKLLFMVANFAPIIPKPKKD